MQTQTTLSNETLIYWQEWYKIRLLPQLTPFSEVQEPGNYTVFLSKHKYVEFYDIWSYRNQVVDKATKLKVGSEYRKDIYGFVVPEDLADKFRECADVSKAYRRLIRSSIDIASELNVNGYARIKALSPEKMQKFIDLFS